MNKPILLQEYLNKELKFNIVEIKFLFRKYSEQFLNNGCELHSSDYVVIDSKKVNDFINNERDKSQKKIKSIYPRKKKKRKEKKIKSIYPRKELPLKEDKTKFDNSSATPNQSKKLLDIRWAIELKIKYSLTYTDFLVLSEFILLTQHGFNNDLPVNQGEISKSIGVSPSNVRKSVARLIELDLLNKYKPKNRTSLVNNFSLNLEKLTGLNCRKVIK